jgi:hypothetical protein
VLPESLRAFFASASARRRLAAALRGAAIGLAVSLPAAALAWSGAIGTIPAIAVPVLGALVGASIAAWRTAARADAVAAAIETRDRSARNLLVTAAEIDLRALPVRDDVRSVVFRDAAAAAARVSIAGVFPIRRPALWCVGLAAAWALALSLPSARGVLPSALQPGGRGAAAVPTIGRIVVTVTPPDYTHRAPETISDPASLEVLAGSELSIDIEAAAASVELAAAGATHRLAPVSAGRFAGRATIREDGFIAVQPFGDADAAGVRAVIPVTARADKAPTARITEPGKDLFLAKPDQRLAVKVEATDDIALASLRLTYTKVTGGGENFKFVDGEVPLAATRTRDDAWTGTATLPLPALGLAAGDTLVYRAVVADARPGAAPVESDAFIVQILQPGEALSEGFALDDEKDRYAISQQMIIIKTQRLIANRPKLSAEAFADEAATLAAEQRKVRAEFVFMMGGEFEDVATETGELNEEAEAAAESDLLAGRMQNNGRRDVILATRYMSEAAQQLTHEDPEGALPNEKSALAALQRAFTKSRYILRVLAPRERIDATRRLSGKLDAAADWRRPASVASPDPRALALTNALAAVRPLSQRDAYSAADGNALAAAAETVLRLDSSLAPVAQAFSAAAAAVASGAPAERVARLVDQAAIALSAAARQGVAAAPPSSDLTARRLVGALGDVRRPGGRP